MTSPTNDASPAKKPYASAPDVTPHAATPADLALQLRSVGSRIRKTVTEGYNTQRSAPSSPAKPPPHATIFTSANDVLHDIFGSAPAHPPVSPKKRAREDDSDHESADNMAVDSKAGRGNDTESDGETVIILDSKGARPVKPRPRRPLMQSQSLPTDVFGPLSGHNIAASMPEQIPEADWSANHSRTSSQPPAFEPMVLNFYRNTVHVSGSRFLGTP